MNRHTSESATAHFNQEHYEIRSKVVALESVWMKILKDFPYSRVNCDDQSCILNEVFEALEVPLGKPDDTYELFTSIISSDTILKSPNQ
jgi:hypothetical protein